MATIDEIKQQAAAVKNATQVGENTAERVGGALAGLAEIAEQQDSKLSDLSAEASFHFNEGHNDYYNIVFPIKKGNKYLVISTYDGITINTTKDFNSYLQTGIANKKVFVADQDANGIRGYINNATSNGDITIYSGIKVDIFNVQGSIDNLANTKFDKSSIAQETGYAEDKVMSQKAVSSKLSDLSAEASFHFNEGHNDYYNIVFPIKKGNKYLVVSTYDGVTINTTNDFSGYLQTGIANKQVFVADQDANGIRGWISRAPLGGDITIYSGLNISEPTFKKSLFTIGDSLCDTGVWQTHLANLKCMVFDQSINKGQFPISYGGTTTGYIASNSGINRARNLVEVSKKQPVDYVIIENINDRHYVDGKITDSAWMINQTLIPHSTFDTEEEANSYIENLSSILSSIASDKRLKGSVIVVNSKSTTRNAYKLTVTSKATIEGDITITDSNGMSRSVHVTTDMEITDIASEIARYNFGSGWDTSDNKDGSVTISYYTTPDKTFSFNSNNTGVNVTIEEDYNVVSTKRYFTGYSSSEWEDTTKWVSYINLYQLYKGMLEYLKSNLPNAKIYWLIPTTFTLGFNGTEYANSDGSFNMEKYKDSAYYKQMQKLFDCQKEVAKYYDIPILDMEEYSNINLFNAYEFYYANDVHPKTNGYRRWAETISKILL